MKRGENMPERVTLRLEDFDDDITNEISFKGPVRIFKTVNTFEELDPLVDLPDFPNIEDNEDNLGDLTQHPDVIVFVKNITNFPESLKYRGAYFRYNYITGTWQEILLGTHSHENKEILDKIGTGDIGNWSDITNYPSITISSDILDRQNNSNSNSLFLHTDIAEYILYRATRTGSITVWEEIPLIVGIDFPADPHIRDIFFNIETEKLFIFSGSKAGERKMLVLEVTDPDNTDLTYSYDVTWSELPQTIPIVPENTISDDLYLGLDSAGNATWKNTLIASQSFQFKQIKIVALTESNPIVGPDEQIGPTNFVSIPNIRYDSNLDEILVLDGVFFLINRDISYNKNLRVLTVTTNEGLFDIGSTISVLIIKNGAAAVLDELAEDYITKADAINLLSGGSINLKNYATKTDLQTRALKNHTHSHFSKIGHNHDMRYANYKHTHSEYLTRRKVLELIQETLATNPDITDILYSFSEYLQSNEEGLNDLILALNNINLNGIQSDILDIQTQIDILNGDSYKNELVDYIQNNINLKTDQIYTDFIDVSTQENKNLSQFLAELYEDIQKDLNIIDTTNVLVNENIHVKLGENQYLGGINDDEIIPAGMTIHEALKKLLRKRVIPTYNKAELITEFDVKLNPEVGEVIPLEITSNYQINDSGSLSSYRIYIASENDTISLLNVDNIQIYSGDISLEDKPITISTMATYSRGPLKYDNFGEESPYEILFENNTYLNKGLPAGNTEVKSQIITPVRAIFYGSLNTLIQPQDITSTHIRNLEKFTDQEYSIFEIEGSIAPGSGTIIFAMPKVEAGYLDSIEYREQFYQDILSLFSLREIPVVDAAGVRPVLYNVYSLKLPFLSSSNMHLKFKKK